MNAGEILIDAAPYLTVAAGSVGGYYLDRRAVNRAAKTEDTISQTMQRAIAQPEDSPKNQENKPSRIIRFGRATVASALSIGITTGAAFSAYEFVNSALSHQNDAAPVEVVVDASGLALVDHRIDTIDQIAENLFQGDNEISPQAVIAGSNNAQPSKPGQANLVNDVEQSKKFAGGSSEVFSTASQNAITTAYARSTPVTTNGFISTTEKRAAVVEITDGNDPGTASSIQSTETQNGGDLPIFVINVSKTHADRANLQAIASETGGVYKEATPNNAANIANLIRKKATPHGETKHNSLDWPWLAMSIGLTAVEVGYLMQRKKFAFKRGVKG
jgi:Mg-chelatase subunit ChlD